MSRERLTVPQYAKSELNKGELTEQAINQRIRKNQPLPNVVQVDKIPFGKKHINMLVVEVEK